MKWARDARRSSHCRNTQLEAGAYNPRWETGCLRKGTRYENSQKRMIAATADDLARRFANFRPGQIRIGAAGTF